MNLAHQRSKRIDIKYYFIRSEIHEGRINLEYIPSEENVEDIFAKPASKDKLEEFRGLMLGIDNSQ